MAGTVAAADTPADATSWGENGRIAFSSYGEIYTVESDGAELTHVVRDLEDEKHDWSPAWSPNGSRIVVGGRVLEDVNGHVSWSDTDLQIFSPDGSVFDRLQTPSQHSSSVPAWSPDGTRIAYATDMLGNPSIRSVQPDGQMDRSVLASTLHNGYSEPAWSPDGSRIAFVSDVDDYGETDLFTMRPDGTGILKLLSRPGLDLSPSWSPDGRTILFTGTMPRQGTDTSWWWPEWNVYSVPSAGGSVTQLTASGTDRDPVWSPQGNRIAFESDRHMPPEQTAPDVYVMEADGSSERRITSIGCSRCEPDWQPLPTDEPRPPWTFQEPPSVDAPPVGQAVPPRDSWVPGRRMSPRELGAAPTPLSTTAIGRLTVVPRSFRWRRGGRLVIRLDAPGPRRVRLRITREGAARNCRSRSSPCRAISVVRRLRPGRDVLSVKALALAGLRPGGYRLTASVSGSVEARTTFRVRPRR